MQHHSAKLYEEFYGNTPFIILRGPEHGSAPNKMKQLPGCYIFYYLNTPIHELANEIEQLIQTQEKWNILWPRMNEFYLLPLYEKLKPYLDENLSTKE